MKISAYIITVDSGFSPNAFGRYCTLACCKPTIRRNAEVGDVIIGVASARYPHEGRLVYAMRVKEILTFKDYWDDPRFASKKPMAGRIRKRGDNIWFKDGGRWRVVPDAMHGMEQRKRDIGGKNVLIATEFFYFGAEAIRIPDRFRNLLATTQDHKNCHDESTINDFWTWVSAKAPNGRVGDPSEFDDEGCSAERTKTECDDTEETQ